MAVRREVRLWWEQAKRDLLVAQRNHANRDYDVAVFLCEQAVQKALEAVIIHVTDREPPKIHNLVELGRLAGAPKSMGDFLAELTPHYMLTRYPDAAGALTSELYTGRMSLHFIRGTRKVFVWARRHLR